MPNLFKRCTICNVERNAETEFHYNGQHYNHGRRKKRSDCIYCCRARRSAYFKEPEKRTRINNRRRKDYKNDGGARRDRNRRNALWNLYRITPEQYDQMLKAQNEKCAMCSIHYSEATKKRLYVDHDHKTKKVRGLLCNKCNIILGYFDHDLGRIERTVDFLGRTRSEG